MCIRDSEIAYRKCLLTAMDQFRSCSIPDAAFYLTFFIQILDYFRAREHAVNGPVGVENIRKPHQKRGPFSRPVLSNNIITSIHDEYWSILLVLST